jgi:hypothetical protein
MTPERNGSTWLQGEEARDDSQGYSRLRVFGTDRGTMSWAERDLHGNQWFNRDELSYERHDFNN